MIDVLVAGGGPAGLVTALNAARAGMRVVVVEPRPAPIDKACGEGLMPGGVAALQRLGVQPRGRQLRGIRYRDGDRSATADFAHGPGLGIRRTELHRALHEAVTRAGVSIESARVSGVEQDADSVRAAGIRARYLVAADGLHSTIRRDVGLAAAAPSIRPRWGIRAHYRTESCPERVEVHWAPSAEAYVTPVADDLVGIAVLSDERGPFGERLQAFPTLRELAADAPTTKVRAAGPLRQPASGRVAGRVLLVGDAAGYVDALTGEGLALSFACAAAAVERIATGRAEAYERDWRRLTLSYRLLTSALLWAGRRPQLRRRIVPAAVAQPWLFRRAVAALEHV